MRLITDALLQETDGEVKELTVNSARTVQPVALMRMGVFVPKPARKNAAALEIDATELLATLDIMGSEGYTNIRIIGPRLDMEMDFKTWAGIIQAFHNYGRKSNQISLPFTEFAKYCGFPTKRLDKKLRTKLDFSMTKIRAKTLAFSNQEKTKHYSTGLIKTAHVDMENDRVDLEADERLWDLYRDDYRVLLRMKAFGQLARQELAQTLYAFFESLPSKPWPVSFTRLRERVCLISEIKGQNRAIRNGLEKLKEIGYLDYSLTEKNRETYVIIHGRYPALTRKE
ncbi:protein RepA [Salmonella enterica]|nr:protein RepA [Salmonella enterica]